MQRSINLNSTAVTNVGLVRENNEDSYLSLPEHKFWAIADGMGGCESGEIASAIVISSLKNDFVEGQNLTTAIQHCHHAVKKAAVDGIGATGMGSTIVALKIRDNHYQIAWVGDSRSYLWRSQLKCLTKDHSYIQLMLDQGLIAEDQIENHRYNHAITQALGGKNSAINVDIVEGELQQGDIFILCSDGLSGEVSFKDIEKILSNHDKTLSEKALCLVDKALMNGGRDNVTLVLVEIVS